MSAPIFLPLWRGRGCGPPHRRPLDLPSELVDPVGGCSGAARTSRRTRALEGYSRSPNGRIIMKAARFHGRKDIRIEDILEPELRAGTVKIDVAWCGICGTDLHEYLEGPIFVPAPGHPHPLSHEEAPVTLGHEFSGTVSEVGEGVEGLAVGDNVVVEPYFVDGDCDMCRRAATTCAGSWVSSGSPAAVGASAKRSWSISGGCTPSATSPWTRRP